MRKITFLAAALLLAGCSATDIFQTQAPVPDTPLEQTGTAAPAQTGAVSTDTGTAAPVADVVGTGGEVAAQTPSMTASGGAQTPIRPRGPRRDDSFFGDITSVSQGVGSYKVVGALRGDFAKISVTWSHDGGPADEPYFLKKYKPESRVFEYFIAPKFKTILPGKNTYVFTGYKADGTTETKEYSFMETAVVSAGKHCVLDVCIDDSKPFAMSGTTYVQKIDPDTDVEADITVDPAAFVAERYEIDGPSSVRTNVFRRGSVTFRVNKASNCGGGSFKQETFDADGKPSKGAGSSFGAPASLAIGGRTYRLADLNAENATYVYGTLVADKWPSATFSFSDAHIGASLFESAKSDGDLASRFLLSFKEAPGVTFPYVSDEQQSEKIVQISPAAGDLDKQGNLLSAAMTDSLIALGGGRSLVKTGDATSGTIGSSSGQTLPLLRLEKTSDAGYWLMYPAKGYAFQSFAEMCKPVVYAYGAAGTPLSVGVDLRGRGWFTKLIPVFSTGTTWDAVLDGKGGVTVGGKPFPYLYYSAKVADFVPGTRGCAVPGEDAPEFFREKLGKMGLKEDEIRDFVEFWQEKFLPGKRYFVSFQYDGTMDRLAPLSFSRAPDHVNRVLLDAREIPATPDTDRWLPSRVGDRLDAELLRKFDRGGELDVLEWGGVFQDGDGTRTVR